MNLQYYSIHTKDMIGPYKIYPKMTQIITEIRIYSDTSRSFRSGEA